MIIKYILTLIVIFAAGFLTGSLIVDKLNKDTYNSGMDALHESIRNLDKAWEILHDASERLEESKRFREEAMFALSLHTKLHGGEKDG